MSDFPTTTVGGLEISRLIAGSNWFLGYSHQSQSRDHMIKKRMTRDRIADVLEVHLREGVNATLGVRPESEHYTEAVKIAEDRVGRKMYMIGIPTVNIGDAPEDVAEAEKMLDGFEAMGCDICMPHQVSTDPLINRRERCIDKMETYLRMIRDRGMVTGLSTHTPEAPIYADETDLDVDTYIQIYNAAGFLMHVEVDWVQKMIWQRKKPVMTIKPLAAGRLQPLVGLAFSFATLREQDMVAVGTMTPDEAAECIEIARSVMERRAPGVELQKTRSKGTLVGDD